MDHEPDSTIDLPTLVSSPPAPERLAFGRELATVLETAIDQLPDGAREVFILRQVEGMDTAEVAEVLGVSETVVKTRLSRACASLRRDLYEQANVAAANTFVFLRPRCDRIVAAVLARIL